MLREAVVPEGRVIPQQWLVHTTAPGVAADDRQRLDFVVYTAPQPEAKRCAATPRWSPVARDGSAVPGGGAGQKFARNSAPSEGRATSPAVARTACASLQLTWAAAGTTTPRASCAALSACDLSARRPTGSGRCAGLGAQMVGRVGRCGAARSLQGRAR